MTELRDKAVGCYCSEISPPVAAQYIRPSVALQRDLTKAVDQYGQIRLARNWSLAALVLDVPVADKSAVKDIAFRLPTATSGQQKK